MTSVRRRGERLRLSLDTEEAELLVTLALQLVGLLGEDSPHSEQQDPLEALLDVSPERVEVPDDPVLARLLPDAYRDDQAAAEEFRRLTDADLRSTKRAGLGQVVSALTAGAANRPRGGVHVDIEVAQASVWLYALTDVRLAFGTRIGVSEDMDEERATASRDSPRFAEIAIYDWLAWLQESMVHALTGE